MATILDNARILRKTLTDAEKLLWHLLRGRQIGGLRFRRQVPLGRYIADFVCHEANLVIELDGGQHAEQVRYDKKRTQWLEKEGYRVQRFWNNEVLQNVDGVLEVIWQLCEDYISEPNLYPPSCPSPTRGEGT
jgi:very-short-patch-repair endonuclease